MNNAAKLILSTYVHHLYGLALAVRQGCDEVFALAPVPAKDGYIKIDAQIHAKIGAVLIDAANIRKLIHSSSKRGSSESARTFHFRRARTDYLAELLSGLSLKTILDAQLRNSMEHFDEYLDGLGAKLNDGEAPPQQIAAFNMIFSSWETSKVAVGHDVYPLRVYVVADSTYYNFDRKVSIAKLRLEANAIVLRLNGAGELGTDSESGGLMIIFPQVPSAGAGPTVV